MSGFWSGLRHVGWGGIASLPLVVPTDHPDRLDLSDDLCRGPEGRGALSEAVIEARRRIALVKTEAQAPGGTGDHDAGFQTALIRLLCKTEAVSDRQISVTAKAGAGTAWLALELVLRANREMTLWLPDRGCDELHRTAEALLIPMRRYRYLRDDTPELRVSDMLEDLRTCAPGDVVALQACCHDPTGLDLPEAAWGALAGVLIETHAVPLVQVAAPGLGLGIDKDMDGLHQLLVALPSVLVTVDASAMFGLYREAPGMVLVQAETEVEAGRALLMLEHLRDTLIGPAPDYGTQVAATVLHSANLIPMWDRSLRHTRQHIAKLRADFATALREATGTDRWDALATGRGPFAVLPLDATQRMALAQAHGIILRDDGRMNLTAISAGAMARVAQAVAACLSGDTVYTPPAPEVFDAAELAAVRDAVRDATRTPDAADDGAAADQAPQTSAAE